MSTVGTLSKLATGVIGKTAHAVTHPVATVTSAAGQVHRVASSLTGSGAAPAAEEERVDDRPEDARSGEAPPEIITPDPHAAAEAAVAAELARDVEPEPGLPEATEPKAASREAAHGGRADEPTDDWHDELDDGKEVETAAGTTGVSPEINPATGLPHHAPGE
ncbi:hypothetical protein [Nocardioides sp. MH1]|uniref:hypothetical protein n=1 Tax=Nocardioides sp. MH1 TaxID=3242490 RepID=UPI0035220FA7